MAGSRKFAQPDCQTNQMVSKRNDRTGLRTLRNTVSASSFGENGWQHVTRFLVYAALRTHGRPTEWKSPGG